jgi:hypothetical protein
MGAANCEVAALPEPQRPRRRNRWGWSGAAFGVAVAVIQILGGRGYLPWQGFDAVVHNLAQAAVTILVCFLIGSAVDWLRRRSSGSSR